MIGRIHGSLLGVNEDVALVDVSGIGYEVTVSPVLAERLRRLGNGAEVTFVTYYYLQSDPSKSMPILIGFESEAQREFFLQLISVGRLGARSAVRLLTMPISAMARAIEMGDARRLQTLPGIGPQKARDIIAKLQGKVGRYVAVDEEDAAPLPEHVSAETMELEDEALEILLQLGYSQADALRMIGEALARAGDEIGSPDELITVVFRSKPQEAPGALSED
jgi:Holliday junction DNA helicase RuvA